MVSRIKKLFSGALLILWCCFSNNLSAIATSRLILDSVEDFKKGELKSTSLTSDGKLCIAPSITKIYATEEDLVWDIAVSGEKAYLATGNEGKLFMVDLKTNKGSLVADHEEMEIYAIAVDKAGTVFYGASPGGKIYRLVEGAKPELFFDTKEDYIWDLIFDERGNLFAATGRQGRIFKISPDGKGEVYFDSPAANVMTLAFNPQGKLLAGTQGKAFIYRIDEKDKGFVLYQPDQDEVKQLICLSDGTIYAGINAEPARRGEMVERMMRMLEKATAEKAGSAPEAERKAPPKPPAAPAGAEIIQISPDGFVRSIWTAEEPPINCLVFDKVLQLLFVSAGETGKIFQVDDLGNFIICRNLEEKFVLNFFSADNYLLLATGSPGNLYSLGIKEYKEGVYLSSVLDAGATVKWGQLEAQARLPKKSQLKVRYRVGNTSEPDSSWSEWSKPVEIKNGFLPLTAPVSRFIQLELFLLGSPDLDEKQAFKALTVANLPLIERFNWMPYVDYLYIYNIGMNVAPQFKSLKIEVAGEKEKRPAPAASKKEQPAEKSSGKPANSVTTSGPLEKAPDSNPKQITISWEFTDPNEDQLLYELYFKGEEETTWKLIEDKLKDNKYEFSTASIPDGKYRLKVLATDKPTNPENIAKTAEFISDIFIVDNTPPEITKLLTTSDDKKSVTISATAQDATSIIVSARYNLDAREWLYLLPEDGLFDSNVESFTFTLKDLKPGEHTLAFLVTDDAGNSSTRKVVFNVK